MEKKPVMHTPILNRHWPNSPGRPARPGRTDLLEVAPRVEALILAGAVYHNACKQIGLNSRDFSIARRLLRADKRNDLSTHERKLVNEAIEFLKTGYIGRADAIMRTLNGHVFADPGSVRGVHRSSASEYRQRQRKQAFDKAIDLVANACEHHCTDITIPTLSDKDREAALARLREARHAVLKLMNQLTGVANGKDID